MGEEYKLTPEAILIETCLQIVNKDGEKVPFILNNVQKHYDAHRGKRDIVLKARQEGFSSFIDAIMTVECMSRDNIRCVLLAHDRESTEKIFDRVRFFINNMKGGLKPDLTRSSRREFYFKQRNSSFFIGTAGNVEFGRGDTVHRLHLSEVASFEDASSLAAGVLESIPRSGIVWIESTAKGRGTWFHRRCVRAVDGRGSYKIHFYPWNVFPEYVVKPRLSKADLSEEERGLVEQFKLTLGQVQWRRDKIEDMDDSEAVGGANLFPQEYPLCVTRETRVSTERGILQIAEALNCKRTESGVISSATIQPKSEIYLLETKAGRTLRGTPDHPIHTPLGFTLLSDLVPNQKITLRPPMFSEREKVVSWCDPPLLENTIRITPEFGRFVGYFMGDGSWYKGSISVVCDAKDEDVIKDVSYLYTKFLGEPHLRNISKVQGRKGAVEVRKSCKDSYKSFKILGLINTADCLSNFRREICVPEIIFQSPKEVIKEFLRGLFESDGSSTKEGTVRIASSKQKFMQEVQLLLLGFGITSKVSSNPKKSGCGNVYPCWMLILTQAESERFFNEIGFVGKRKSSMKTASSSRIGRPRNEIEFIDEVKSVTKDGYEVVYDFTVEPDHVFSANGILTHNTMDEAFLASGKSVFRIVPQASGKVIEKSRFLRIWQQPVPRHTYTAGVDVAAGVGSNRSIISVLDCDTFEQVAEWASDCVDPDELAYEIRDLANRFNEASVVPELNNHGLATIESLRRIYPVGKIMQRYQYDKREAIERTDQLGWLTTQKSKSQMITALRKALRHGLKVYSDEARSELTTFVEDDHGALGAQSGCYDDRVIALALAVVGYKHLYYPADTVVPNDTKHFSFKTQRQLAIKQFVAAKGLKPSVFHNRPNTGFAN